MNASRAPERSVGKEPTGSISYSSALATMRYDGAGRRIVYAVQNQGDLDVTQHAYYDGQSEIESRNGSDQVLRQYVWGNLANQYIDAICQVALNQDPWDTTEDSVERFFYVMQDANFNTIGVVTDAGRLIERYMYTPYGQRQVYTHGWLMSDLNGDGVGCRKRELINHIHCRYREQSNPPPTEPLMPIHPILVLLMLAAPSAVADLQWPRLQVERSVAVGAASATGTFAFTNFGDQPVQITEVRTSCGAATAALGKST